MSVLVFEKLTQTLAASATWPLRIRGDYFRLARADWPVTVRLYKAEREIGAMANMLAGDYVQGVDFDAVQIDNGSIAQIITAQIAGGGVGSDRVLGEVSVISGEMQRVKGDQAFIAQSNVGAVAGQYSHAQLHNPAGSGKNVFVNRIDVMAAAPAVLIVNRYATALTTLDGTGDSKRIGGTASVAQRRQQTNATELGSRIGFIGVPAANQTYALQLTEPIELQPGQGVLVLPAIVATAVYATWQWIEEV